MADSPIAAPAPAAPQPIIVMPPAPSPQIVSGVTGMANNAIDALKTSPILLLIVLLNMAFAGAGAYMLVMGLSLAATQMVHEGDIRHKERMLMLERCVVDQRHPGTK